MSKAECPVAVLAEYMAGMMVDINRTQSEELAASARGDKREAERLNHRSDVLEEALHKARDALPGIRAKSHLGVIAQVAVMSAFADWMDETDDDVTRHQLAVAIEKMAHSVVSFLATEAGIDRGHAALSYFLPTYMDHMQPRPD